MKNTYIDIRNCTAYLVQMAYMILQKNFSLSIKSLSKRFGISHTQSINVSGLKVKVCIKVWKHTNKAYDLQNPFFSTHAV